MKIVSDGIIFEAQAQGGISRIYKEIFPRMCDMEQALKIEILTSGKLKQALPTHAHITRHFFPPLEYFIRPIGSYLAARQKTRAFLQHFLLRIPKDAIWHSTYYTLPQKWNGPIVVFVHDMIHERFPHLYEGTHFDHYRRHKQHCIMTADAVVCISETTRQDIKNFYNIDLANSYVVPLAHSLVFTPLSDEHHPTSLKFQKPFMLYIGGRTTYKNFHLLLQAYSRWPRRKNVDLVVVGAKWSKIERQQLDQYGITQQVNLITNADDHELCKLYHEAIAFIYPSLYEGFGIPLLEAMACNCPIIASNIPSTTEVAGDYPIYFESTSIESFIEALDTGYYDSLREERLKLGLARINEYSWDKTAKQVLKIYSDLV